MAEPKIEVPLDVATEPLQLFGNIKNLRDRLSLPPDLRYHWLRAALMGEPSAEAEVLALQDAWRAWKRQFLLSHVLQREDYHAFVVTRGEEALARERDLQERVLTWARVKL